MSETRPEKSLDLLKTNPHINPSLGTNLLEVHCLLHPVLTNDRGEPAVSYR